MNFEESVKYLYSLGNEVTAMKLGLENPRKLLQSLNNPHDKYLKVQVAGTNGKGSTCAFLDSICHQASIKTGLFTSPHLISITERIKIAGEEISETDFAIYATEVRKITEQEKLYATFFEQITAIALLAFAENGVELAILETGMGGRLDATTAANAEIVAITPIDYDHQQYLGETLTEIAGEKAAIIRQDTKAIIAPQHKEAEQVIKGKCKEVGIEPIWVTTDVKSMVYVDGYKTSEKYQCGYKIVSTSFRSPKMTYPNIVLSLQGDHQIENASVAIRIAETLQNSGFRITDFDICLGLETAKHKGRLEIFQGILFDGAHNIAGANALAEYLKKSVHQPITLIFGAMKDKQIQQIAEILFPLADTLILTEAENSRTAKANDLNEYAKQNKTVILTQNVNESLEIAKMFPENQICITGSLYLVGEAQKILQEK